MRRGPGWPVTAKLWLSLEAQHSKVWQWLQPTPFVATDPPPGWWQGTVPSIGTQSTTLSSCWPCRMCSCSLHLLSHWMSLGEAV